jgi:hypothetical protein
MHGRYPAVVRLQVHLPGQQLVLFTADGTVGDKGSGLSPQGRRRSPSSSL